jgi:hypothetical protein
MTNENNQKNQSFIKHLIFIGLVTIVSMGATRFFMLNYLSHLFNSPQYTSYQSQKQAD